MHTTNLILYTTFMQNDNDCAIPKLRNVMHDSEAVYAHTVKYPFHVVGWTMDLNIKIRKVKNRGKLKTRY